MLFRSKKDVPWQLEPQTIDRHSKGPHKNDPGRSRAVYEPLAALFTSAGQNKDGTLRFGIELVEGVPRAYIESIRSGERFYICLVWQESWSANPFARSKYIKGKLVYQAAPGEGFFARPFCIEDDHVSVPIGSGLRESVPRALPPDWIKLGCEG